METNEIRNEAEDEVEINLLDLFCYVLRRAWIIILVTIVFAAVAYVGSSYFMTKYYKSSTTIWVSDSSDDIADYCVDVITSRYVIEEVADQLELNDSVSSLSSHVSAELAEDTPMITITVSYTDPEMAQQIANLIVDVATERIPDVVDVSNLTVNIVDEANIPTSYSSPNVRRYTILGALAGICLSLIVLIVLYMLDDTIKTDEDVVKYLGFTTLASIPEMDENADKKDSKKSHKKSKSSSEKKSSSEDVSEEDY